jgi:hypothetical protein
MQIIGILNLGEWIGYPFFMKGNLLFKLSIPSDSCLSVNSRCVSHHPACLPPAFAISSHKR